MRRGGRGVWLYIKFPSILCVISFLLYFNQMDRETLREFPPFGTSFAFCCWLNPYLFFPRPRGAGGKPRVRRCNPLTLPPDREDSRRDIKAI